MSSVPLSMQQLEIIAEVVSRDLLEQWAINDRFKVEDLAAATQNAVNDTIFVINGFMSLVNEMMTQEASEKKIII